MATNFWTSSHHANWTFSDKETLRKVREQISIHGFKPGEVQRLHSFAIEYIHKAGQKLRLRQRVLSTASVYYKRFYVRASICDFDPRLVAPTVLFIASKVEESALSMKSFANVLHNPIAVFASSPQSTIKIPYHLEDVQECEFFAMEVLGYDLIVFHPYRPLVQFLQEMKLLDCLQTAWELVNDSYRTDLCLLHSPYLIAIGVIVVACTFREKDCRTWQKRLNVESKTVVDVAQTLLQLYETYQNSAKGIVAAGCPELQVDDLLQRLDKIFVKSINKRHASEASKQPLPQPILQPPAAAMLGESLPPSSFAVV